MFTVRNIYEPNSDSSVKCRKFHFDLFNWFSGITKTIYRERQNSSIAKQTRFTLKQRLW